MLASDFNNPFAHLDVNEDFVYSARDALNIINYLGRVGRGGQLPLERPINEFYYDTNGDGRATALDALLVINGLGRKETYPSGLRDTERLSREITFPVQSQVDGTAIEHTFEISTTFDNESSTKSILNDRLVVYVESVGGGAIIRSNGETLTEPIFSLSADASQIVAGVTRWNGNALIVNTSDFQDSGDVVVKFQLLNLNQTTKSEVRVDAPTSARQSDASILNSLRLSKTIASPGVAIDFSGLEINNQLSIEPGSFAYDRRSGNFSVELQILNASNVSLHEYAIVFSNLPVSVSVSNASGTTPAGKPYVSFRRNDFGGGLGPNDRSSFLQVSLSNPNDIPLDGLQLEVWGGEQNAPPILNVPESITVRPGEQVRLSSIASDPNGDRVELSFGNGNRVPRSSFSSNEIVIEPSPADIGSYPVVIRASDGQLSSTASTTIHVVNDSTGITRLSGSILDVDGQALVGLRVEIGNVASLTDSQGRFELGFGSGLPVSDTLRIRGDLFSSDSVYPFVAEKLPLLINHELYVGYQNVVDRPIYLPRLNSGTAVTPAANQTVSQALVDDESPAQVVIQAGSLFDQQGMPFSGNLSITEVPIDRTPAALPRNLIPDTVVTIQPGEMSFATPAALTLPNRSSFPAGTMMDLWSINPTTGEFERVGAGQVSGDGSTVTTIEGGIRNSSWHFFAPPPTISPVSETGKNDCNADRPTACATSNVEVYSGTYFEDHSLPSYSSLGVDRSLTLLYSSKRSDSQQVLRFNTNLPAWFDPESPSDNIGVGVRINYGGTTYNNPGLPRGSSNRFSIPTGKVRSTERVSLGIPIDLNQLPDGEYQYALAIGAYRGDGSQATASTTDLTGSFVKASGRNSEFGAGWGLVGLQYLIEASDESSITLVDGNGRELLYRRLADGSYQSPAGDFSTLSKQAEGSFQKRSKEGTVSRFDSTRRLSSETDRNGNLTRYQYNSSGKLESVTDPIGLVTRLIYTSGRLTSIQLPDGRSTDFVIDGAGDLTQITDPDGSVRRFSYDSAHRMVSEITPRGFLETAEYDSTGRVAKVIRADASVMLFAPAELAGITNLIRGTGTQVPLPTPQQASATTIVMPSGNVVRSEVNSLGLVTESRDSLGLGRSSVYGPNTLPTEVVDARGSSLDLVYDEKGNPTFVTRDVSVQQRLFGAQKIQAGLDGLAFPGRTVFPAVDTLLAIGAGDVDGDGDDEVIAAGNRVINNTVVKVLLTYGIGGSDLSGPPIESGAFPGTDYTVSVEDLNGDGFADIVTGSFDGGGDYGASIYFGDGTGVFSISSFVPSENGTLNNALVGNFDADDLPDLLLWRSNLNKFVVLRNNGDESFETTERLVFDFATNVDIIKLKDVDGDGITEIVVLHENRTKLSVFNLNDMAGLDEDVAVALPSQVNDFDFVSTTDSFRFDIAFIASPGAASFILREKDQFASESRHSFETTQFFPLVNGIRLSGSNSGSLVFQLPSTPGDGSLQISRDVADSLEEPTRYAAGRGVSSRIVADVNGDGLEDLVGLTFDKGIQVLTQTRGSQPFPIATAINASPGLFGDYNGDGFVDLTSFDAVSQTSTRSFGDGNGNFADSDSSVSVPGISPSVVRVGDFNNDDNDDMFLVQSGKAGILTTLETGGIGPISLIDTTLDAADLKLQDVNDDGLMDAVAAGFRLVNGQVSNRGIDIYINDGQGSVSTVEITGLAFVASFVHLGDFDGNGTTDILVVENQPLGFSSSLIHFEFFSNNGDGTFADPVLFTPGVPAAAGSFSEVGDFNNDGLTDIVYMNLAQQTLETYLSQGDFSFTTISSRAYQGWGTTGLLIADVNEDGNLDVVSADGRTQGAENAFSILLGTGQGTFESRVSFDMVYPMQSFAFQDIDSDGKKDFLSFSNGVLYAVGTVPAVAIESLRSEIKYESLYSQIAESVDELGRVTTFDVDPTNGNTTAIHFADGSSDSITYTDQGLVETSTDSLGRLTERSYNDRGLLERIVYAVSEPEQISTTYTYTPAGDVASMTDANGNETRFEYDAKRRLILSIDAINGETAYQRDAAGNVISMIDPLGRETKYVFDAINRLTQMTNPLGNVTRYSYDTSGNRTSAADPLGNVTRYVYDVANRMTAMIDADGYSTSYSYDRNSNLVSVTDANGNVTRHFYDERNRRIRTQNAFGDSMFMLYDGADNLVGQMDYNGNITRFAFDPLNRLISSTLPDTDPTEIVKSAVFSQTFDLVGNVSSSTDAEGNPTEFFYNALDRLVRRVDAQGGVTSFQYDGNGNLTLQTDELGRQTRFAYDKLDRLTKRTDANGATVDYSYDAVGNLLSLTDSRGNVTRYRYDDGDRLIEEIDPTNASSTYEYDIDDRMVRSVDRLGRAITYSYDPLDRVIEEAWEGENYTVTSTYDPVGNLLSISNPTSSLAYGYDELNRVVEVTTSGGSIQPDVLVTYDFDSNSNVVTVSDSFGSSSTSVGYSYDAEDRLVELTQSGTGVGDKRVGFSYSANSLLVSMDRYGGLSTDASVVSSSFIYDTLNRIERINHATSAMPSLAFFDFTYDVASQITSKGDRNGSVSYGHDLSGQLLTADYSEEAFADESFDLDELGNRVTSNGGETQYQTGVVNRLTSDGEFTYEYDLEGNLAKRTNAASGEVRLFVWDFRNRLVQITDQDESGLALQTAKYFYDPLNRRIGKAVDATPNDAVDAAIESYVYDREDIILEFVDADGPGPAEPQNTLRYLHGPGIDQPLARDNRTQVSWLLADHLGSIVSVVDNAGAEIASATYDSFGNAVELNGQLGRYAFTGREFDSESGLHFYRARYYDGAIGRFISEDPIGFAGQDESLYRYVENRPAGYSDPSGQISVGNYLGAVDDVWKHYTEALGDSLLTQRDWLSTNKDQIGDALLSGVPVFGPLRDAIRDFGCERYAGGALNLAWGIYDIGMIAAAPATGGLSLAGLALPRFGAKSLDNVARALSKTPASAKNLVLGEGMDAVKSAARGLRSEGVDAKWYQAWGKNFPTNRPMTQAELASALARNERWIRQKVKEGYQFYDIGLDATRSIRSPFYELEQRVLKELGVKSTPLPRQGV